MMKKEDLLNKGKEITELVNSERFQLSLNEAAQGRREALANLNRALLDLQYAAGDFKKVVEELRKTNARIRK